MSSDITIDRDRLAQYFERECSALAANADLTVDLDYTTSDGSVEGYEATVRIQLEGIPISAVEAQDGK